MTRYLSFNIHSDNIVECERTFDLASSTMKCNTWENGLKAVYTIEKANIDIEAKYEKYHQSTGLDGDIFMVGMKYLF